MWNIQIFNIANDASSKGVNVSFKGIRKACKFTPRTEHRVRLINPPHLWPVLAMPICCFPGGRKASSTMRIPRKKLLYFEWSPPWHVGWRLSGEGCHWEYDGKNGEFENIDFRFPWLSDTSEMGFGHDVPFLNYSDRLPHPSDLCQPDRVRWG